MVELLNSKLEVTWSAEEKTILDAAVALAEESHQPTFIRDVLLFLYQHSRAKFILVSRKGPQPEEMTSLGLLVDGTLTFEQITYSLAGTPCELVQKHEICYFPRDTQALFPTDEYLSLYGIDSYFGAPLLNATGEVTGLVTLMHQEPLANPTLIELILSILSPPLEELLEASA
ncbi:hypothetical protein TH63_13155 [Rufibacter radiotolerans]|uniref:GAF domain-containing protein n=1 Tax=Rufibacter radiotolerans TaxID=1379910 RepID=A0A0H4VLZ8_9BACT|nr:GAF domain-containing protein [Rufibacter radiotolerans]AKQ46358.1 hypothetical protein TH63_13155 [Rufibacter radiotolerans]